MEITVKGTPEITVKGSSNEIADLVLKLQNRQSVEKTVETLLFHTKNLAKAIRDIPEDNSSKIVR